MHLKNVALLIREGEGGAILLGVRDDGTLAGEKLTNDLKGRINSLARNCKPGIRVEMLRAGGVVAVQVPEGVEKPYSCGSGYFRRLNGSSQKMSHEEIRIMFRENDPFPFEERPAKDFGFDDLSRAKVLAFAKEAGLNIGKTTTGDFLRSLKVADETGVKTSRRNELIADLFFRLDKVERVGQGIQRMKDAMADAGLKEPEFDANGFFRAVFYRSAEFSPKGQKTPQKTPQMILTELESRVLQKKGAVRRAGPDRGGYWEILK